MSLSGLLRCFTSDWHIQLETAVNCIVSTHPINSSQSAQGVEVAVHATVEFSGIVTWNL